MKNLWSYINTAKGRVLTAAGMAVAGIQNTLTAHAADVDTGFLTEKPGEDVFGGVTDTVKNAGASLYQLLLVIGVIGFVISLILAGLNLAFTRNSNRRGEEKSNLLWIFVGMIIVFGAMAIIGLAQQVGSSL